MKLKDKVVIITGAKQGIGEAAAVAMAREGAAVVLVSRSIRPDSPVVEKIKETGGRYLTMSVDVSDRGQVQRMVDETLAAFGRVDVLFNNAGISKPAMLWKMTEEQWDEVININLKGTFNCIQAVSKPMMEQKKGAIINVTSSAGLIGTIGQVNYTAAKGGVHALTKSAAKELARYNITVNVIAPMAETEMTKTIANDPRFRDKYLERIPLGRFAKSEEIAPCVVFLASDEAGYITGQTICVDGGMVMM
ncbi:MAG: glucose 1-dehydrogenase [Peptococcaceae bacterium]|nr:glucose 1-dehydrogenase [Peptococcaceae bacterium]